MKPVPKVSCLIAAYDVERWIERSIESALAQDWPADRLEVIVVNDGSTDDTEAAIAPYRDRIRYVRKENGGLVSATNAGLEIATGDLICFLDGDDTWPVDRLRRQVPVLQSRPELGLVHGDMTIVDENGAVLHPSFFAHKHMEVPRGRVLGRLMHGNFVSAGGILVRASLRDRFFPISESCPYQDWYIASRVAEVAEIDHVDWSVYNYRFHGGNESLGATGEAFVAAIRRDVPWLLWMQRNLDTSRVAVEELAKSHGILLAYATGVARQTGVGIAELMPAVGAGDLALAATESAHAADALAGGRVEEAIRAWLRALAANPLDGAARASLAQALDLYARMPRAPRREVAAGTASSPRVAVVIPCFNHGRYLRETVESVLAQTFRDLEVVVVDDGSTDDSAAVAEALCEAHLDRVRLLRQPNAGHPSVARNKGIGATSSEYVLCLDADDQLPPDWLAACVAALDARPDAGVAYTDQQDFGATDHYHVVAEYDMRAQAHKNWFGICSLFRRAAWDAVGGWDADIAFSEDWDFWIGCGWHGFPAIKVHGVAWRYRTSGDGRQAAIDMENDRHVKAQLVLKRPGLYDETQLEWARGVLNGDPRALAVPHELGIVPAHPVLPESAPAESPEVRSFATVALADEVVLRPELLEAYARTFGEDDDATLVIYAAGGDSDSLVQRLGPVLAERGLDGDGAPDMLAYAAPASLGDSVLAARAGAVLSCRRPAGALASLPRFDAGSIDALTELARG